MADETLIEELGELRDDLEVIMEKRPEMIQMLLNVIKEGRFSSETEIGKDSAKYRRNPPKEKREKKRALKK